MFSGGAPEAKDDQSWLEGDFEKMGRQAGDAVQNGNPSEKVRPVMQAIKIAGAKLDQLPPDWKHGITQVPNLDDIWLVPYEARAFYAEKADEAEEWIPELKAVTPGEKIAKSVAVLGWYEYVQALQGVLGWRRGQLAHVGIDPNTGVDVMA